MLISTETQFHRDFIYHSKRPLGRPRIDASFRHCPHIQSPRHCSQVGLSAVQQDFPADEYEIILVVDGSTDGTADALRLLAPTSRLRIIEQENHGPSAARNAGYRAAKADLLLFLDDDMLCDPELLAAHVAAHMKADGVVAFGALFLSADTPPSLAAECFRREIGAFHLERERRSGAEWRVTDCVFSNASLSRSAARRGRRVRRSIPDA